MDAKDQQLIFERIVKLETKLEQQDVKIDKLEGTVTDLKKSIDAELKDIKHILQSMLDHKSKMDGGWKVLTVLGGISIALVAFGKLAVDLFKN